MILDIQLHGKGDKLQATHKMKEKRRASSHRVNLKEMNLLSLNMFIGKGGRTK